MNGSWDPIYETIDEAAIAALDSIYPYSRNSRVEYAVAIYQERNSLLYGYTDFVTDNHKKKVKLIASSSSGFVAHGHTHPHKRKEGYRPHHISNHKQAAHTLWTPMYWIAPNGTVHVYEPATGKYRMVRRHRNKPNIVR